MANRMQFASTERVWGAVDSRFGKQITDWLEGKVAWVGIPNERSGTPVRMLDCACGRGLVSKVCKYFLAPRLSFFRK